MATIEIEILQGDDEAVPFAHLLHANWRFAMNMASRTKSPYPPDKLAKLRSLADIHEQLAIELRLEVALLSGTVAPAETLTRAKEVARRLLAFRRRLRGAYQQKLGDSFLQDPALDLILEVFIQQAGHRQTSITGLHNKTESSQTTALRWGAKLCEVGIGVRSADVHDHRREWFALTREFFDQCAVMLDLIGADPGPDAGAARIRGRDPSVPARG